jgi:hypothetical protein
MQSAWHFVLILTTFGFSWQVFIKVPNIKFHENPFGGSQVDTCRQMDTHITMVTGAFPNMRKRAYINYSIKIVLTLLLYDLNEYYIYSFKTDFGAVRDW